MTIGVLSRRHPQPPRPWHRPVARPEPTRTLPDDPRTELGLPLLESQAMAIPCPLRDLRVSVVKKRKNHRGTEGTETTDCPDYAPSSTIPISSSVRSYKLVPQPIDLPVRSINLPLEQLLGHRNLGVGELHAQCRAMASPWPIGRPSIGHGCTRIFTELSLYFFPCPSVEIRVPFNLRM